MDLNELKSTLNESLQGIKDELQSVKGDVTKFNELESQLNDVKSKLEYVTKSQKASGVDVSNNVEKSFAALILDTAAKFRNIQVKPSVQKSIDNLNISDLGSAGGFIREDIAEGIIPLLTADSVVRSSGAMIMPMPNGNTTLQLEKSGTTAYWVGQDVETTISKPTFEFRKLTAKKLAARVVLSNDLIRYSSENILGFVQNQLRRDMSLKEDLGFLNGAGTSFEPKGMLSWAGNTVTANGTVNATNIMIDLIKAEDSLAADNVPGNRKVWFMHPSVANGLKVRFTTTGDLMPYAIELLTTGRLFGSPVFETTQMPTNKVILADMSFNWIGESYNLEMTVDQITRGGYDQTEVRILHSVDFAPSNDDSICAITLPTDWKLS
jgi:HK97 family phage major capsid protein